MIEQKHVFPSEGESCASGLYLPEHSNRDVAVANNDGVNDPGASAGETLPPVVIMAQGFGAERAMGTGGFVRAFVDAGLAVFSFDYRGFGESTGKPRQLVHPGRHCQDWYNAVQYVRSLATIDNRRIFLWGSSFSGGHVLVTAARIPGLAGVISQVPFCQARGTAGSVPLTTGLAVAGHALFDLFLSAFGAEHRIAIVAEPGGEMAAMRYPGWCRDYLAIAAGSPTWENSLPARSMMYMSQYNPIDSAGRIDCPVLIISGSRDQGVPRQGVHATAEKIRNCEHIELDFDHFDLYEGFSLHNRAVELQLEFLQKHRQP